VAKSCGLFLTPWPLPKAGAAGACSNPNSESAGKVPRAFMTFLW